MKGVEVGGEGVAGGDGGVRWQVGKREVEKMEVEERRGADIGRGKGERIGGADGWAGDTVQGMRRVKKREVAEEVKKVGRGDTREVP